MFEQESAHHRADGDAETGEAGPHGDGPAALLRVAEDVGEDRQRGGHDQRAADAHEGTGEDQLVGRLGQRGGDRAHPEQDDADLQGALSAESVGQAAGGEEQTGEDEDVGVDDPLDLAVAGAEVGHQRGDGHVEDRVVHHDDQQAHAEHGEDQPSTFVHLRIERIVLERIDTATAVRRTCRRLDLDCWTFETSPLRYGTDQYRNGRNACVLTHRHRTPVTSASQPVIPRL